MCDMCEFAGTYLPKYDSVSCPYTFFCPMKFFVYKGTEKFISPNEVKEHIKIHERIDRYVGDPVGKYITEYLTDMNII